MEIWPFYFHFNTNQFQNFNFRFLDNLNNTVSLSDKLGYIYWFAVLTTISCGCATGIYVTLTTRNAMVQSCQEKYEIYENFILRHQIELGDVPWVIEENGTIFSRQTFTGHDEINDLAQRINFIDQQIRCLILDIFFLFSCFEIFVFFSFLSYPHCVFLQKVK